MARAIDSEVAFRLLTEQFVKETGAFSKGVNKGLNIARSAMRNPDAISTLTPPNEPLSIEQLREMGGQPVYMPDTNCWALVTQNAFCPILTFPDGEKCSVYDWYEQVGPVYRRPPEGEEDT